MKTPFTILEVPEDADDTAVKRAYLRMVRQHPPERDPLGFREVRDAFERIRTERLRLAYWLFYSEPPQARDLLERVVSGATPGRPTAALVRRILLEALGGQKT